MMKEPPVMLSTKDTMYICDILNVTYAFVKKFNHYLESVEDEQIKQLLTNIASGLKNQFNSLLEVLNG